MPYNDICLRNKRGNVKRTRKMLEANEMKVLRTIVHKTKIDIIRCQQRESSGIQRINERVERKSRYWDNHVTRIWFQIKLLSENKFIMCALGNWLYQISRKKFEPKPGFEPSEIRIPVQLQIFLLRSDNKRLVKNSRNNVPAGRSPGCPKRRWSDLIPEEEEIWGYTSGIQLRKFGDWHSTHTMQYKWL